MDIKAYLISEFSQKEDLIDKFLNEFKDKIEGFVSSTFQTYMDSDLLDDALITSGKDTEIIASKTEQKSTTNKPEDTMLNEDFFKPDNKSIDSAKDNAFQFEINNKHITLPNAKVGQEYRFNFDIGKLQIAEIGEYGFTGLDEIGLSFHKEDSLILGIPTKAGDYKISMYCKRKDWQEGKPIFERNVTLIINPDPRSLWNNIPTSQDVEYYKQDSDSSFVKVLSTKEGGFLGLNKKDVSRKDIVAASQRGRSHAHEGKPRDDDFRIKYDEDTQWYIMVVADGAGSAKFSRKGSQIACDTVLAACEKHIGERTNLYKHISDFIKSKSDEDKKKIGDDIYHIIGAAAFQAHLNIEKESIEKGALIKDYATTLLISICKKFDFGWFVGAFWVGDGGIGIYDKRSSFLKLLGIPDGGEFAGQTRFLTMKEIVQPSEIYSRLRFDIVEDFTALILMTDGITDPKFETDANLNRIEKWDELWSDLSKEVEFIDDNEQSAEQLMKWLDFWSAGNHDDRTIAILF